VGILASKSVEKIGSLSAPDGTWMLYVPNDQEPKETFKLIKLGDWNGPIRKRLQELQGKRVKVVGEITDINFLSVESVEGEK
jgi:hypothetical protein